MQTSNMAARGLITSPKSPQYYSASGQHSFIAAFQATRNILVQSVCINQPLLRAIRAALLPHCLLLDIGADTVGVHLPHGDGADEVELVVEAGQVHWQIQVMLLHSPVADPASAVAQPLGVLQVERQRAAGAGRAEGV